MIVIAVIVAMVEVVMVVVVLVVVVLVVSFISKLYSNETRTNILSVTICTLNHCCIPLVVNRETVRLVKLANKMMETIILSAYIIQWIFIQVWWQWIIHPVEIWFHDVLHGIHSGYWDVMISHWHHRRKCVISRPVRHMNNYPSIEKSSWNRAGYVVFRCMIVNYIVV